MAFLNNGQLTIASALNLRPAVYISDGNNPVKAPFMLFLRLDPASNTAWLTMSPEPFFSQAVLWTVPTNLNLLESVAFASETGVPPGLLPGIIYVQNTTSLQAYYMHNGQLLWTYTFPNTQSSPTNIPIPSPIIAKKAGTTKSFLFVLTNGGNNGNFLLNNLGCCSGNGMCLLGSTACQCAPGFYGTHCTVFCNLTACNGLTGQCTVNGTCMCNTNFYGPNCLIECHAATTCSGHGTCDKNTGACVCNSPNTLEFENYSGINCKSGYTNWYFIGCVIGAGLIVILIIVIVVVSVTKKKTRSGGSTKKSKIKRPLLSHAE